MLYTIGIGGIAAYICTVSADRSLAISQIPSTVPTGGSGGALGRGAGVCVMSLRLIVARDTFARQCTFSMTQIPRPSGQQKERVRTAHPRSWVVSGLAKVVVVALEEEEEGAEEEEMSRFGMLLQNTWKIEPNGCSSRDRNMAPQPPNCSRFCD